MAEAEDVDFEELKRDANEAMEIGEKIVPTLDGHSFISIMGALSVTLADVLIAAEEQGNTTAEQQLVGFMISVSGVLAAKKKAAREKSNLQ
jgi:hypothetical protein